MGTHRPLRRGAPVGAHAERGACRRAPGDRRARRAGLVIVEQRVVLLAAGAEDVRLLPLERDDLFEPRPERGEVLLLPRLDPRLLRGRGLGDLAALDRDGCVTALGFGV